MSQEASQPQESQPAAAAPQGTMRHPQGSIIIPMKPTSEVEHPYADFQPTSAAETRTVIIDIGTYSTAGIGVDKKGEITGFHEYERSALVNYKGSWFFGEDAISKEWSLPDKTEICYPFRNGVILNDGSAAKFLNHVLDHLQSKASFFGFGPATTKELIVSIPSGDHVSVHIKELTAYAKAKGLKIRFIKQSVAALIGGGFELGAGHSVLGIDLGGGTIMVIIMDSDGEIIAEEILTGFGGTTANADIVEALEVAGYLARTETVEQMKRLVANGERMGGEYDPYLADSSEGDGEQYVVFWGKLRTKLQPQWCQVPVSAVSTPIERNAKKTGVAVHRVTNQLLGKPHLQDHLNSIFQPGGVILSGGTSKVERVRMEIAERLAIEIPEVPYPDTLVLKGMRKIHRLGLVGKLELKTR